MKNLPLVVSIIVNVLFFVLIGLYLFTPFLDWTVINTSMPRLCDYIEENQPDLQPSFCELDQ